MSDVTHKEALARFTAKHKHSCKTSDKKIPCKNKWYKRTFGFAVPRWREKETQKNKQWAWLGTPRFFHHINYADVSKTRIPWIPKGEDAKYARSDKRPIFTVFGEGNRYATPEETRQAAIEHAVRMDTKLLKEIDAWKKKIRCAKEECIGPETRKGGVENSRSDRDWDRYDVSEYEARPIGKGRFYEAGVCIKLEFKCLLPPKKDDCVGGSGMLDWTSKPRPGAPPCWGDYWYGKPLFAMAPGGTAGQRGAWVVSATVSERAPDDSSEEPQMESRATPSGCGCEDCSCSASHSERAETDGIVDAIKRTAEWYLLAANEQASEPFWLLATVLDGLSRGPPSQR